MSDTTCYRALVAARQACRACPGLLNPSQVDGLDSDRIGPYSLWQGNLNTELMVVGQDFSDVESFRRLRGWPGETSPTNLALVALLASAGITIAAPRFGRSEDRLFFTNAVLCLKQGGMSAPISHAHARTCGRRFLRPLVELVAPRAIATLGLTALDALLHAFGQGRTGGLTSLLDARRTFTLPCGPRVFPMWHPGQLARASRALDRQRADWAELGAWLRAEGRPGGIPSDPA